VQKGPDAFRTISEVAEELDLPQHVLRFWEARFSQIKPMKRGGGRRYYRPDDVDLLRGIRHLLYGEGYTIRGVQRILREQGPRFVIGAGQGEAASLSDAAERQREEIEDEPDALLARDIGGRVEPNLDDGGVNGAAAPEIEVGPVEHASDEGAMARVARRLMGRGASEAGDQATGAGLAGDEVRRLQSTLSELLELKRLLDQAR
jgi:DNA-binding transcriptional MerR regulator